MYAFLHFLDGFTGNTFQEFIDLIKQAFARFFTAVLFHRIQSGISFIEIISQFANASGDIFHNINDFLRLICEVFRHFIMRYFGDSGIFQSDDSCAAAISFQCSHFTEELSCTHFREFLFSFFSVVYNNCNFTFLNLVKAVSGIAFMNNHITLFEVLKLCHGKYTFLMKYKSSYLLKSLIYYIKIQTFLQEENSMKK